MFATCDPQQAVRFLNIAYPESKLAGDEPFLLPLLELVKADKVRVQDPCCHWPAQIVPGTHWSEVERPATLAICQAFHAAAKAKAPNQFAEMEGGE